MAGPVTRAALWVLALGTALRIFLAAWLPLGTDETYAIAVAREFSWSFFDHPPIGFWLPVAMANLTGLETAFIYRLPFLLCGFVTAACVWRLGAIIGGTRTAYFGLLLFMLAPYMLIGGGVFVVPDGPLNMFLALSALALIRALSSDRLSDWLLTGLWLAFAMACKYQAGLFPVSVLAFLLLTRAQWRRLLRAGPWLAAAVGLLGLTPVVLWNLQNDWASFAFHTGRVGPSFQPANFAQMLLGQAIYLVPATFVFGVIALWQATRRDATLETRLLAWIAIGPIGMFMVTYIYGTSTFPHWTMPGWLFAMPLAGHWLATRSGQWAWRSLLGFAVPLWALLLVLIAHVPTGMLTRGADVIPDWDDTTEIFDFAELEAEAENAGWLNADSLVVSLDWIEAGHLSTGLRGAYPIRVIGKEPHHFQYMRGADMTENAVLLIPGRGKRYERDIASAEQIAQNAGARLEPLGEITLPRAGRPYMHVTAFRVIW